MPFNVEPFTVEIFEETFPIAGRFVISRGSKTEAHVVRVVISNGKYTGHGECVPYARYDETVTSVVAQINSVKSELTRGCSRMDLQKLMTAGSARNAVDSALWDFEAKQSGRSAFKTAGVETGRAVITAYTLSMGTPNSMAEAARVAAHRPLLKIKVGGTGDIERLRAVTDAAPQSKIIVDANEGWNDENVVDNLNLCAHLGVVLVEQPLPANKDAILSTFKHPLLICADESVHHSADLALLADRYDAVNIKLDKSGGLTEALQMLKVAKDIGMQTMIGCMVGTSLAMAPALALAQTADFVDLDGPLLLAKDRNPGLRYDGSLVYPPEAALWG